MTPEEINNFDSRLQELEKHKQSVEALKNRIYTYDKLVGTTQELKNQIDEQRNNLSETGDLLNTFSFNYEEESEKNRKNFTDILNFINLISQEAYSVKKDHNQHLQDFSNFSNSISNHVEKIREELKESVKAKPDKADIDFAYNCLKTILNDFSDRFESHKKEFDNFKQKIQTETSALLNSSVSLSVYKMDQESNSNSISNIKNEISSLRETTLANTSSIKDKFVVAMQELKDSIFKMPQPNDDLKKEFDKKLESVSLDAKNAALRTQNSDQKIMILEKKLENVNLLLKKYELNQ